MFHQECSSVSTSGMSGQMSVDSDAVCSRQQHGAIIDVSLRARTCYDPARLAK